MRAVYNMLRENELDALLQQDRIDVANKEVTIRTENETLVVEGNLSQTFQRVQQLLCEQYQIIWRVCCGHSSFRHVEENRKPLLLHARVRGQGTGRLRGLHVLLLCATEDHGRPDEADCFLSERHGAYSVEHIIV